MGKDQVEIAVAVIPDGMGRWLLVHHERWDCFTFPMTKIKGAGAQPESVVNAALRAAREVIPVPATASGHELGVALPKYQLSGRDRQSRFYHFHPVTIELPIQAGEPVPDSDARRWLSPHQLRRGAGVLLSPSVEFLTSHILHALTGCERVVSTVALYLKSRSQADRVLLRWSRRWGCYNLPTRALSPDDEAAGAEVVYVNELGLQPGRLTLKPHTVVHTVGRSHSVQEDVNLVLSSYHHRVFEGELISEGEINSSAPVVWASVNEIMGLHTSASLPSEGRSAPAGPISYTTREIAIELGDLREQAEHEATQRRQNWLDFLSRDLESRRGDLASH